MQARIKQSRLSGVVTIPGSKSLMQRACVLALLKGGVTFLENPAGSEDDIAVLSIIEKLGAGVKDVEGRLKIVGNKHINFSGTLNCGESGLAIRMMVPVAAISPATICLTGEGSLRHRPMDFFDDVLPALGVEVKTAGGFLPIEVKGPLIPKNIIVDGSQSSQFITGLLFAFCFLAHEKTTIRVTGIVSRPYLDMSVSLLREFGFEIHQPSPDEFIIGSKRHIEMPITYRISGDWSGGAFFLVAGAICGDLAIHGLDTTSPQGDKAIVDVLKKAGANIFISGDEIRVDDRNKLMAFGYDASDTPDLFPPLVALAVFCEGVSVIGGAHRLLKKESNRQAALLDVFTSLGAKVWVEGNSLKVEGGHKLRSGEVNGYNDHRIVMAVAIAALASQTDITISGTEAVSKSYPAFFQHLIQLGAQVSLT